MDKSKRVLERDSRCVLKYPAKDSITGCSFYTIPLEVEHAIHNLNQIFYREKFVDLNTFLKMFSAPISTHGYYYGWNLRRLGKLIDVSYHYEESNKKPILVLDYITKPEYNFRD